MTPQQAHELREKRLREALERRLLTFEEICRELSNRTGWIGPRMVAERVSTRQVTKQTARGGKSGKTFYQSGLER